MVKVRDHSQVALQGSDDQFSFQLPIGLAPSTSVLPYIVSRV
jgi:hypothetical protein